MGKPQRIQPRAKGFTLVEVMVAMTVVTAISLVVLGALAPWMSFKQDLDNRSRMQALKSGMLHFYADNAWAVDTSASATSFGQFSQSAVSGAGQCEDQSAAFQQAANYFSDSSELMAQDGYRNSWCVFVRRYSVVKDAVSLNWRVAVFVSPGRNGTLDSSDDGSGTVTYSGFSADGQPVSYGDDSLVVVSGYDIQNKHYETTRDRLARVSAAFEAHFTLKYLSNPDRDVARYYFSTEDGGTIPSSGGTWASLTGVTGQLAISTADTASPWKLSVTSSPWVFEYGNYNEGSAQGLRSPWATSGRGVLPYTVLIRAPLPAPGSINYVYQVAVGRY